MEGSGGHIPSAAVAAAATAAAAAGRGRRCSGIAAAPSAPPLPAAPAEKHEEAAGESGREKSAAMCVRVVCLWCVCVRAPVWFVRVCVVCVVCVRGVCVPPDNREYICVALLFLRSASAHERLRLSEREYAA